MRLICPNCGAQYEVDAGVIPETGRDVQCSNCGHTWFQRHARQEAEIEERHQGDAVQGDPETAPAGGEHGATDQPSLDQPSPDQPSPQETPSQPPEPAPEPEPEPAPQPAADQQAAADVTAAADETTAPTPPSEAAQKPQQTLDQGVADILRQEAERESQVRASESGGLETQPDLGLAAGPRESAAPTPEANTAADGHGSATDTGDATRGNLLPDIEEINSTLAAAPGGQGSDSDARDEQIRRRSGFRRGFTYAILVFAVMALVYVFSAKIAETVPQTGPALAAYVDWINGLRSSVDAMMLRAVDKLTSLLAQLSSNA
jgi:predicted Zn finger-like uncharacterized protein